MRYYVIFVFFVLLSFSSYADRASRPFEVRQFEQAGLEVYIPGKPPWNYHIEERTSGHAVLLSTPDAYYPMTAMEILLNPNQRVRQGDLEVVALSAINKIRWDLGFKKRLQPSDLIQIEYGKLRVYAHVFHLKHDGQRYSMKAMVGAMPSQQPITFLVSTPRGQLEHIEHMVYKIAKNLSVLTSALPKKS